MDYICKYCNKKYKSYHSRSNHYRLYHKPESIVCQLNVNPSVNPSVNPKVDKPSAVSEGLIKSITKGDFLDKNVNLISKQDNKYVCIRCDIKFTTRQAKSRHILKSCNKNDRLQKENDIIKKENLEIKNELNKIKDLLKLCKIHPKTLQKINNQLINQTTNNGMINNGTINNNTVNIVKFGTENLNEILSQSEMMKILNRKMCSLEESIKMIHFNDDRPEFKNIYITNLKDQYAYIYNGNKFIAVLKSDILEELVDNHIDNIEYSAEEYKEKLQKKTIEILDKFIEKMNNEEDEFVDKQHKKSYPNFKSYNINQIKLMIYNMSDKKTNVVNVICSKNEIPVIE